MEALDLSHVPEDKRDQIESWWAHCRDHNLDEYQYASFFDEHTTRPEIAAFLSPFECADEQVQLVAEILWNEVTEPASDDASLVAALRDYVTELAHNALVVGQYEMANRARSVADFRLVDEIDRRSHRHPLSTDIQLAVVVAAATTKGELVAMSWLDGS